jgi:hypothetical protein
MLSVSRALLTKAKGKKATYWRFEVAAASCSTVAAVIPWTVASATLALGAVALKIFARQVLVASRRTFRLGERARRYDFYGRTLGWPVPPSDRADMVLVRLAPGVHREAARLAGTETDYYAHNGPPSTQRLLCNLAESMFWTERLMGAMAKVRWRHVATAVAALVLVLLGTLMMQPTHGLGVLKFICSAVTLLVATDLFGEAKSFERGESEASKLLSAIGTEMARATPSEGEGVRLMSEYNCLLADLPLLPDSIYRSNQIALNSAWTAFQKSLPRGCGESRD